MGQIISTFFTGLGILLLTIGLTIPIPAGVIIFVSRKLKDRIFRYQSAFMAALGIASWTIVIAKTEGAKDGVKLLYSNWHAWWFIAPQAAVGLTLWAYAAYFTGLKNGHKNVISEKHKENE